MKKIKLLMILLVCSTLTFVSCSKEEQEEQPSPQTNNSGGGGSGKDCTCGVVISKNPALVRVTLQNVCSNNIGYFTVPYAVMDNANNGDTICPDNEPAWRIEL